MIECIGQYFLCQNTWQTWEFVPCPFFTYPIMGKFKPAKENNSLLVMFSIPSSQYTLFIMILPSRIPLLSDSRISKKNYEVSSEFMKRTMNLEFEKDIYDLVTHSLRHNHNLVNPNSFPKW